MNGKRVKAAALLVLAIAGLMSTQLASSYGNLFLAGEIAVEGRAAHAIIGAVGIISEAGIGAAAIVLCINPWLALGVGIAYGL